MRIAAALAVAVVAALHVYFLVLEIFLWKTPWGRRSFGTTPEFAESTSVLAANQGVYNGFLAAGLVWALAAYGVAGGAPILTFFLVCVCVAGVFGAVTADKRILVVQAIPGATALALVWLAR